MIFVLLIQQVYAQSIYFIESQNQSAIQPVYNQSSGMNPYFFIPHPECCTPTNLYALNMSTQSFDLEIVATLFEIYNSTVRLTSSGKGISLNYEYQNASTLMITTGCGKNSVKDSGLQQIQFTALNQINNENISISISFWQQCSATSQFNFDWSLILIVIFGTTCVAFYASLMKIRSIQIKLSDFKENEWILKWIASQNFESEESQSIYFQGFRVNLWYMGIYLLFTALFYLIVFIAPNSWFYICMGICLLLGLFCGYFWFNELQCFLSANLKLKTKVFHIIRVCDIISIILILTVEILYVVYNYPWYLTDIIAFCIGGSIIKLFKFTSLKSATLLLSAAIIFDLIYYLLINLVIKVNYQQYVLQYANYPVLFELPLFQYSYNRICSWLSIFDLIMPGLVIAYLNRFDKNRNSKIYLIIGLLGLLFGILFWILVMVYTSLINVQLPQSFFVSPLLIGSVIFWGYKQGDLRVIWHGSFYDKFLMDNFLMKTKQETEITEDDQAIFNDLELK